MKQYRKYNAKISVVVLAEPALVSIFKKALKINKALEINKALKINNVRKSSN